MLVVSKFLFTFVKSNEKWDFSHKMDLNNMKDRIRQLMESLHLSQQEFSERTQIGTATLSNIFNGRTHPSIKVIELIKKNLPDISIDWLLLGVGPMYVNTTASDPQLVDSHNDAQSQSLPFDGFSTPTPQQGSSTISQNHPSKVVRNDTTELLSKLVEKPQRKVTEIRVYYDDQTWESFVPSKK